ncbi:(4Fe-4S)-binding protein [Corynebacterium sp. SCR221107]|nr:(4Fe-4S)-binding protein [Corynebacterium sp. SCR221107]WBT10137.1 (4Fe-4S)-binding protein [Corynebacterium sp. SCR221107]
MCQHSGNCVRGDSEVFSAQRRPWINPAGNSPEAIAAVIDTCSSGALRYVVDGGGANS